MRTTLRTATLAAVLTLAVPASAYAVDGGGDVPTALSTGAGIVALLLAAGLLVQMLSLRKLAEGAAIADNITYAVLAIICLAAGVLVGWVADLLPTGFSAEQARLGADLLTIASLVLFGVYFYRVRRAMARFLSVLTGAQQDLVAALDADKDLPATSEDERA